MKRLILSLAAGVLCSGCAAIGAPVGAIFTSETYTQSYDSPTQPLSGSTPDAHGEACSTGILDLVAWGDAGYDAAYRVALASSGASSIYDVRVDKKVVSILFGLYSSYCTELTGRVAR